MDLIEIEYLRDTAKGLRGLLDLPFINIGTIGRDDLRYAGDSIRDRVAEHEKAVKLLEGLESEAAQRIIKEYESLLAVCGVYDALKQSKYPYYCSFAFRTARPGFRLNVSEQLSGFLEFDRRTHALKAKIAGFAEGLEKAIDDLIATPHPSRPIPAMKTEGLWEGDSLKKLRQIDSNPKRDGIKGDKKLLRRLTDYLRRRHKRADMAQTLSLTNDGRIVTTMPHRSMFFDE